MPSAVSFILLFLTAPLPGNAGRPDVLVHLSSRAESLLESLPSKGTRTGVRSMLAAHARSSQARVIQVLEQKQVQYTSFWIDNILAVKGPSPEVLRTLSGHPDVASIEEDIKLHLPRLERVNDFPEDLQMGSGTYKAQGNIAELHAPELWEAGFTGHNTVVATIDSGVRWTHEALRTNYRGFVAGGEANHDYSFWTPDSQKLTPDNADLFGHGSHVMGTLAGSGPDGIGMAPNSTWITAKAFDWNGAASKSNILAAAQWTLCPTKYDHSHEDCSKGADLVSCSFGGNSSTTWLNPSVKVMRAAGVLPIFSAGNVDASKCSTILEPAAMPEAVAVGGADTRLKLLYRQSGKGPGLDGVIKPDFVAPYLAIRSICSGADNGRSGYMRLTGTSMSAPHVSGGLALLHSVVSRRGKDMQVVQKDLLSALKNTTQRNFKKPLLTPGNCGGIEYSKYPNNDYGWGFPDVCAAASSLGTKCEGVRDKAEMLV